MKKPILLLLVILSCLHLGAQIGIHPMGLPQLKGDAPSTYHPPVAPLPEEERDLDPVLVQFLQFTLDTEQSQRNIKGLSAALRLPDGETWVGTSGQSSASLPMQSNMLLGMGSVTKTFTAAAILQLVDSGRLSLEDSLYNWFPNQQHVDPNVTLRQLLKHTSGVFDYTGNQRFWDSTNANLNRIWQPQELLDGYLQAPLFAPGASWSYSNTNYLILGMILEQVTGKAFQQILQDRFYTPLSLNSISLYPQEGLNGPQANLWADLTGNMQLQDFTAQGGSLLSLFSGAWAAGALMCTAEDLAGWGYHLHAGSVLSDSIKSEMRDFLTVNPSLGYGLGAMRVSLGGQDCWGHGGDIIYAAGMYYAPDDEVSISLLSNDGLVGSNGLLPVMDSLLQAYQKYQASTTAVSPLANPMETLVFPNPAESSVYFRFFLPQPATPELKLYDLQGKVLRQQSLGRFPGGQQNVSIELNGLSPGVYGYMLKAGDGTSRGRLVKK